MEQESKVTVDFTIKGADPNAKVAPDAECAMCGRTFEQHTIDGHKACAKKQREQIFGKQE